MGLHMNPDNRWIKMADCIPWDKFEIKYAELFPSDIGNVAKPLRMALGALIIQTKFQYSDRELVEQLTENPYLQYFIGLPGYQEEAPFDASTLVLFRKRISAEMLMEANEYLLSHKDDDNNTPPSSWGSDDNGSSKEDINKGTLTLDATCAPANIRYPQDVSLLNEAREKLETIIYRFCKYYGLPLPRRYKRRARKDYLAFAKSKKHSAKKIRKALRKQLSYVARDIRYLDEFMSDGYAMTEKEIDLYLTIIMLYEQQKYMYDNKIHSVEHRIVSISQPWLRPIVRGKAKAPVEFGAKFDLSIDSEGYGRIEKISFEAYNESTCLIDAVERFKNRTGHYPKRVLADQIYRTRKNRNYCKDHGIRLSGPKLGRPCANAKIDKKQEYQDNTDRIEVERTFSLSKRCYGMGCITTKLKETQLTSVALSVFVTNLFKIQKRILCALLHLFRFWDRYKYWSLQMSY
ncbi:IS5 family transposase [bacterium 1xD8-6]|nr:IS5 family transposase [bacterium D16-36]RKI60821.1 IS5 family transposase [bacterium 1xD8-6]